MPWLMGSPGRYRIWPLLIPIDIQTRPVPMTKLNTYTKGNRIEKLCRNMFEKKGWITWKPSRAKYNSNDAFGLFDCIMIRGGEVIFMQIKSTPSHFYHARKEISAWIQKNNLSIEALVSLYEGNSKWRIELYDYINCEWIQFPLDNA